ncbi:MAG: RDD family protein [Elusimicrobia bacterium]|nr:RDD family protein [Elusimicrobiota bacterium]
MAVTKNLTILLTDIKGFTDKTSHQTRAAIDALLEDYKTIVLPVLEGRGGKLIKTIGDAYLMTFESPTDAVLAGIAVQDALRKRNEGRAADDRIEVRIAINSGEVNLVDGDIFGEPVNITARIESVAEAGEVFFTEAVYLAMNKTEVPSSEVDTYLLKGITERIKVYKVRRETPVGSGQMSEKKPSTHEPAPKAVPAGALHAAAPAPAASTPGERAGLARRLGALVLDLIICGMLAGMLSGGDRTEVQYRNRSPKLPKLPASGTFSAGPDGVKITGSDGSEAVIGEKGIQAKAADGTELSVGEKGVVVTNPKVEPGPKRTVDVKVGLAGVDVTERQDDPDDEEDGVRVVKKHRSEKDKLFPFVWVILNALTLAAWGATPGKKLLGLQVVTYSGSAPIDNKTAVLRSLFTLVSAAPVGLGYLWVLWEKDKRGWHDLLAGTRVVRAVR